MTTRPARFATALGALLMTALLAGFAAPPDAPAAPQTPPAGDAPKAAPSTAPSGTQDKPANAQPAPAPAPKGDVAKGDTTKGEAAKSEATKKPPIYALFECESGSFRVELATKQAPRLCANFINLANRGYFDGKPWTDFSRVVRQTGINPAGADPDYTLPRELSKDLLFDLPGRLCCSNNSDDVATARAKPTRIFITVRPQERWNLQYAVFGIIVDGLDVAASLKDGEKIIRVRIDGDYKSHQERYAKQIVQWNAALDKVGLIDRR